MHKLYELKEKLVDEMEGYADNGKYSKEDIELIKYMSSAVDHICNIIEKYDEEDEYSMMGESYEGGSYARDGRGGNRGGRGRSNAMYSRARRRDAMGRYSRAEDDFRMELQELINDAPNDRIRQKMQGIMSEMM